MFSCPLMCFCCFSGSDFLPIYVLCSVLVPFQVEYWLHPGDKCFLLVALFSSLPFCLAFEGYMTSHNWATFKFHLNFWYLERELLIKGNRKFNALMISHLLDLALERAQPSDTGQQVQNPCYFLTDLQHDLVQVSEMFFTSTEVICKLKGGYLVGLLDVKLYKTTCKEGSMVSSQLELR